MTPLVLTHAENPSDSGSVSKLSTETLVTNCPPSHHGVSSQTACRLSPPENVRIPIRGFRETLPPGTSRRCEPSAVPRPDHPDPSRLARQRSPSTKDSDGRAGPQRRYRGESRGEGDPFKQGLCKREGDSTVSTGKDSGILALRVITRGQSVGQKTMTLGEPRAPLGGPKSALGGPRPPQRYTN